MKSHAKEAFLASQASFCVSTMGHWKPHWVTISSGYFSPVFKLG